MKQLFGIVLMLMVCIGINAQSPQTTNARVIVGTCPEKVQGIKSPYIAIESYKFKSRKRIIERMLNDFDRTETTGYRLNLTMTITNLDKDTHSFSSSCLALIDEQGFEYEIANESEDIRRDVLVGSIACKPNISRRIILSYVVPDKNKQYRVVFKHFE